MYLGVNYYPEQCDEKYLVADITRMADAKVNCIRIADFGWQIMEPTEGEYDFSYFTQILDIAHLFNIKVILGTPTAALPAWLAKEFPLILSEDEAGVKRSFGGRSIACLNSPIFDDKTERITSRMAHAYKNHPAVIGWQIDNELGYENSDWCYCDVCEKKFQSYLRNKFTHIESLNEALGTVFWSQSYNEFNEIAIPKTTIGAKNPGLMLYFYRFRAETITNFVAKQAQILKDIIPEKQFITHNFHGDYYTKAQNCSAMAKHLDVVALNNYPATEKPTHYGKTAMKFAQTRGLLDHNFWVAEQLIGADGYTSVGYQPRPNQLSLWSYQAMLHGCNNLIYSRWRSANKGAEQLCHGVLEHNNRDGARYHEMLNLFTQANKYKAELSSRIKAKVALLYDADNIYAWKIQPQSTNLDVAQEHYRLYQGFHSLNIPVDVIDLNCDFSDYKVLLLPIPMLISDESVTKLEEFIYAGGSVITSFRGGLKQEHNEIRFDCENPLHKLAGIEVNYFESLGSTSQTQIINHTQTTTYTGSVWRDMLTLLDDTKILYSYTDESFNEYAAVSLRKLGDNDGRIYYVGCGVEELEFWQDFAIKAARRYNLAYYIAPSGIEIIQRLNTIFVLNHNEHKLNYLGLEFKPYQVTVLSMDEFEERYSQ